MNHGQRRSAQVRWLLFWPALARELGRTRGRERKEGLCSACVASLADGQRHRRKSDDTWWQLLPEDHIRERSKTYGEDLREASRDVHARLDSLRDEARRSKDRADARDPDMPPPFINTD